MNTTLKSTSASVSPLAEAGSEEPPTKRIKLENGTHLTPTDGTAADSVKVKSEDIATATATATAPTAATTTTLPTTATTTPPITATTQTKEEDKTTSSTTSTDEASSSAASQVGGGSGGSSVVTAGSSPHINSSNSSHNSNSSHDSLTETTATATAATTTTNTAPAVAVAAKILTAAATATTTVAAAVAVAVANPKQVAVTPLTTPPSTTVIAAASVAVAVAAAITTKTAPVAVLPSTPTSTTSRVVSSTSSPTPQSQSQSRLQPHYVASSSTSTLTSATSATIATTIAASSADVPLKALNFGHLQIKYLGELEYMLREFRKLERQLLGAKGAAQLEESAGSRERREKLHSFILHLEDTIRQIELGCKLEDEGKLSSTCTKDRSSNDTQHTDTTTDSAKESADIVGANSSNDAMEEAKKQQMAEESALSNLTKEKEEEENVQKLEEHILANLLPVKVRLKKQLAAQQGATQNPAGMPSLRRGSLQPPSTARGRGTFAEAAEKRRKQAEAVRIAAQEQRERAVKNVSDPSQFGKPLSGGGSSLTQKLHGSTLGSKQRRAGSGVGTPSKQTSEVVKAKQMDAPVVAATGVERKILYAGMVPGSTQQKSGLSAASGAHEMVVTSNNQGNNAIESSANTSGSAPATTTTPALQSTNIIKSAIPVPVVSAAVQASRVITKATTTIAVQPKRIVTTPKATNAEAKTMTATIVEAKATTISGLVKQKRPVISSSAPMSEEEKLKFKKHRRKRKILRLARRRERERLKQPHTKSQQITSTQTPSNNPTTVRKKVVLHHSKGPKKKGPRVVEYICSLCSEAYSSTCDLNPWWALAQHKCPKCQKTQIPRIDITSPANIIEYHPALLSHLEDGGRGGGNAGSIHAQAIGSATMHVVSQIPGIGAAKTSAVPILDSESDSDLSELSDDDISIGSLKAAELEADIQSMTPAERAEHETFGDEYEGPRLSDEHASKLLILMGHASTCPCHHKSEKEKDICRSTKYMMLHVRDCPGTTSTFDVCPFPWCRKVKHLLYHLVSCKEPDQCPICSPKDLPKGLEGLVGLNAHRMKGHRERMIAVAKATLKAKMNPVAKPPPVNGSATATQTNNLRKVISGATLSAAAQAPAAQEFAPVNSKIECAPAQVTSTPSTITATATVDTGDNSSSHVPNPVTIGQPHDPLTQTGTDAYAQSMSQEDSQEDEDFDINAEIAKLDEQLNPDPSEEAYAASDKNHVLQTVKVEASNSGSIALPQSPLAPLTRDSSDGTSAPSDKLAMPNLNASTYSVNCPTSSNVNMAYENSNSNTEISTEDEQVLPTPIFAIKMGDNDADADAAEVSDLLDPSDVYVSSEEMTDFKLDPDFLETSDAITSSDFSMVAGDFSDTTADNNDMIVIASEVAAAAVSIESTPDVATATAAAVIAAAAVAEVNVEHTNTAGGVKVN